MSIFADDFTDLMPSSVSVAKLTGRADDGTPTYATAVSYTARVNTKTHNVIGRDNQLVVARGTAWLDTVDAITADDKVTFSDGTIAVILAVNVEPDENGPAYTRLDFQ